MAATRPSKSRRIRSTVVSFSSGENHRVSRKQDTNPAPVLHSISIYPVHSQVTSAHNRMSRLVVWSSILLLVTTATTPVAVAAAPSSSTFQIQVGPFFRPGLGGDFVVSLLRSKSLIILFFHWSFLWRLPLSHYLP